MVVLKVMTPSVNVEIRLYRKPSIFVVGEVCTPDGNSHSYTIMNSINVTKFG